MRVRLYNLVLGIAMLLLIGASAVNATVRLVPTIYGTVQAGITAAGIGDTVFVLPGTYHEHVTITGKVLTLTSQFPVTQNQNDVQNTIIDGSSNGVALTITSSNVAVVGLSFAHGLTDIKIQTSSTVLVTFCGIGLSVGASGGGVALLTSSHLTMTNSLIAFNVGSSGGGGLFVSGSSIATMSHCVFTHNTAGANGGGAVEADAGTNIDLEYCTLDSNHATDNLSSGIICNNATATVHNSIFKNIGGEAKLNVAGTVLNVSYSDIEGGIGAVTVTAGTLNWGSGNISGDPAFANAVLQLLATSPCINTGDPGSPNDPDGSRADMGAQYYPILHPELAHVPIDYSTIQAAINASNNGDTIIVERGTYPENVVLNKDVIVGSNYYFTANDSDLNMTIINGGGLGATVTSGLNNMATLYGFTVTGGTGHSGSQGGGVYMNHSKMTLKHCLVKGNATAQGGGIYAAASPLVVIRDCIIRNNTATTYGGGLVITMTSPLTLDSCTVDSNGAPSGAGIYVSASNSAVISNSTIAHNTSTGTGGGISISSSLLSLENCTISNNSAVTLGGGIRINSCHPTIDNCTISNNSAVQGGGVNAMSASGTIFNRCTFSSNTATTLGGGMTLSSASATIDSCVFNGNNGGIQGGGLRIYTSAAAVTYSTFSNNSASQGAGIYVAKVGSGFFRNDTIRNNTAVALGGGLQVSSSTFTMDSCLISSNVAPQGAGMRLYISSPTITHTAIVDNNASTGSKSGGGVICASGSKPTFTQCTFSNNSAFRGGAVWCFVDGYPILNTCVLYNDAPQEIYFQGSGAPDSATISYCDLKGGLAGIKKNNNGTVNWGGGNFDSDPLFVNAGAGDYGLTSVSPCVDTGDPGLPQDEDATQADVGAYIYDQDFDNAGHAQRLEAAIAAPKAFALGSGYPNPFNSAIRIPYSVPSESRVLVTLFDMSGRQVAKLVDEVKPAGTFEVSWVASNAPAGIYLVRMSAERYSRTERLVLLK